MSCEFTTLDFLSRRGPPPFRQFSLVNVNAMMHTHGRDGLRIERGWKILIELIERGVPQ